MRPLLVVSVCCLSLTWSSQALARPKTETLHKAAKKACAAGDFRKGIDILADLYVRSDDPTYVYNQGRCYEQNHQWVDAIDRFREYLRKAEKLSPKVTADVEKHIADCKLFLDEETAKTVPPPQPPPPLPPPTPVAPAQPVVVIEAPPPAPAPVGSPGSALRTTGIIVGAVAVATLATAVGLNLKANSLADEANRTQDPGTKSSQKSYKTGAIVCYGIGGAALLTGATLYLVGRWKGTPTTQGLALLPVWKPGQAGLVLEGEF